MIDEILLWQEAYEAVVEELRSLPTVEAQLLAWIEIMKAPNPRVYLSKSWLMDDVMGVYVRKSERLLEREMITCIDIATAKVREDLRGQGRFSAFLRTAISVNPWEAVYFEQVGNEWLAASFRKRGYYEDSFHRSRNFFCFTSKTVQERWLN